MEAIFGSIAAICIFGISMFCMYIDTNYSNRLKYKYLRKDAIKCISKYKYSRKDAIKCWSKLFNYKYVPEYEDRVLMAGRTGEKFLKKYISSHPKFHNCKFFVGKRIYNEELDRKNEIDMVIVSDKKIYVIECKNWGGDVFIDDNIWKYVANINGKFITRIYDNNENINPVDLTKMKSQLLYKKLREQNIPIEIDDIIYKVIFINKNMNVFGDIDKKHVILYDSLNRYMDTENTKNKISFRENLIITLLNLFIKDEEELNIINFTLNPKIGNEKRNKMLQYLELLPTWDYIELHMPPHQMAGSNNLKLYQGDVKAYKNVFYEYVDTNSIKNIKCKRESNKAISLLRVILGAYPLMLHVEFIDGRVTKYLANPDGYIIFQEAGHPTAINIDILKISNIKIGNHKREQL